MRYIVNGRWAKGSHSYLFFCNNIDGYLIRMYRADNNIRAYFINGAVTTFYHKNINKAKASSVNILASSGYLIITDRRANLI